MKHKFYMNEFTISQVVIKKEYGRNIIQLIGYDDECYYQRTIHDDVKIIEIYGSKEMTTANIIDSVGYDLHLFDMDVGTLCLVGMNKKIEIFRSNIDNLDIESSQYLYFEDVQCFQLHSDGFHKFVFLDGTTVIDKFALKYVGQIVSFATIKNYSSNYIFEMDTIEEYNPNGRSFHKDEHIYKMISNNKNLLEYLIMELI